MKAVTSGATPLSALDAVVIDTETSGLDPNRSRVIELGAVNIKHGSLDETGIFESLVNPGVAIGAASTAIHGIDEKMTAAAPAFETAFAAFQRFAAGRVLIGHSIGFDIAILSAEAERHGLIWTRPRSLCVRLLGVIAGGDLPDHSLEALAARFNIDMPVRHRALGDAKTAAAIFAALVPRLEERGIRTLAEAERAIRGLESELRRHAQAGWHEPVQRDGAGVAKRGDPFAYRHRVREIMSGPVECARQDMQAGSVIQMMTERRISSIFISVDGKPGNPVTEYGIVTERDMMRAIAAHGADALNLPVSKFASRPLQSVREDAFVYRAIGRMERLKMRHLAVRSEDGRLTGVITSRDLLKLRASAQFALDDRIEEAATAKDLANAWSLVPAMAEALSGEDVPPRTVTAIISEEIRALTRAAARLAEEEMSQTGKGTAPCPYCVLVLGSGGRGESLLKPDQDNALIYSPADGQPDPDPWFADFGARMNRILNAAGIPLCDGGIMAQNRQWRGTPDEWRRRVDHWICRAEPQDILNADIFFDFFPAHGDIRLGLALFDAAYAAAEGNIGFAKALAAGLEQVSAPLTIFGGLRLKDGRIDLKLHGLFPIVAFARAAAIRHSIAARSTQERLRRLGEANRVPAGEIAMLDKAHALIISLLLEQQRRDIMSGLRPSNMANPSWLDAQGKTRLKKALSSLDNIAELARTAMF